MSDPQPSDAAGGPTADGLTGLEGYPYASVAAEKRIKAIATAGSILALGLLVVGLYLALLTPEAGLGGLLSLVGFIALMMVPFVAKRLRRAALAREAGPV
jgi:putative effector of murein hydrolase LrgA (UPF0299 family)